MNKNSFNVIKISGFKGIALAIFLIACFAVGFTIFPGWICMHIWNFVAGYFVDVPQMTLIHGSILWIIIALSTYALNQNSLLISFKTSRAVPMNNNDEKIKEIIRKIHEHNSRMDNSIKKQEIELDETIIEDDEKITK